MDKITSKRWTRRSPCGERGLKYARQGLNPCSFGGSLPVRGAWIEIVYRILQMVSYKSLPVRGAWIEINMRQIEAEFDTRRSPCGERGLK